jgi:hypothetical protein
MATVHLKANAGSAVNTVSMSAALHHLKEMLRNDSTVAEALRSTETTEQAAHLAWEHGIAVTPEALWRNRGTLESGGKPTWRG